MPDEILYSQGDAADELYFIIDGAITLFADLQSVIPVLDGLIDPLTESFNVPYALYYKQGYFGDSDNYNPTRKRKMIQRESTAYSEQIKSEVWVLKKKKFDDVLKNFP